MSASFHWIIGPTQSWRDEKLLELLDPHLQHPEKNQEFLCIVPTKRREHFLQNRIIKSLHERDFSSWKPDIFILNEFCKYLYEKDCLISKNKNLVNDLEKRICIELTINKIRDQIEYFEPFQVSSSPGMFYHYPGVIKKLAQFISYLKNNNLDDRFIEKIILDDFGNPGPKDHDLTLIHHTYCQILHENKIMDFDDLLLEISKAFKQGCRFDFLKKKETLVLDGLLFLYPLEEELLQDLCQFFQKIIITLDYHDNPEILVDQLENKTERLDYRFYQPLKKFYKKFLNKELFDQKIYLEPKPKINPMMAQFVQEDVPVQSNVEDLLVLKLSSRVEEIRYFCKEIKNLARNKISLERIHVVFPNIEKYLSLIYEIFPEYGIPFSVTRGLPLTSSPIALVIGSILKIPQGFKRDSLFHFFSSKLVSFRKKNDPTKFEIFLNRYEIGEKSSFFDHDGLMSRYQDYFVEQEKNGFSFSHFDVASLDRYARQANIRGGDNLMEDWFVPFDRNYFQGQFHKNFENPHEQERIKRNYFLILRQLFFLEDIFIKFKALNDAESPERVLNEVTKIISDYNIPRNIVQRIQNVPHLPPRDKAILLQRDMKALHKVFQVLDEIEKAFALKKEIDSDKSTNDSYLEWVDHLFDSELKERVLLDALDPDRVQITETLEVRGIEFDYCFFGGLCRGDFPRLSPIDFILPDTPNARFRTLNTLDESRFLFCHILKNTCNKTVLTYPQMEGEEELGCSPFLEDLAFLNPGLIQEGSSNPRHISSNFDLEKELSSFVIPGSSDWSSHFGFLLKESDRCNEIVQALRVELNRYGNIVFTAHDGILGRGVAKERHSYSVSQLEQFANCPQQYFYARILGLEPLDEVTEEARADEFGTFVHEIIEMFFLRWFQEKQQKITPQNFSKSIVLMKKCVDDVLRKNEKYDEYVLWDRQKEKIIGGLDVDSDAEKEPFGILRAFLEYEVSQVDNWKPKWVEKKFGYDQSIELEQVRLRGKIDRVDVSNKTLMVYDYKTGKIPSLGQIRKGLHFQLPVYLWAMKSLYPEYLLGGAYYSLKEPTDIDRVNYFLEPEIIDEAKGAFGRIFRSEQKFSPLLSMLIAKRVKAIDRMNQNGVYHYAFNDKKCRYCDYFYICRRDAARLQKIEERKAEEYYTPRKNINEFVNVSSYQKVKKTIFEVIQKKRDQKKPRFGKKEITLGDELLDCYNSLPPEIQNKIDVSHKEIMFQWESLKREINS